MSFSKYGRTEDDSMGYRLLHANEIWMWEWNLTLLKPNPALNKESLSINDCKIFITGDNWHSSLSHVESADNAWRDERWL